MINEPSELKQIVQPTSSAILTKFEVHLGLSLDESTQHHDLSLEWQENLVHILSGFTPLIIQVNHHGNGDYLSDDLLTMLNSRNYLIQPQKDQWIICSRYLYTFQTIYQLYKLLS